MMVERIQKGQRRRRSRRRGRESVIEPAGQEIIVGIIIIVGKEFPPE